MAVLDHSLTSFGDCLVAIIARRSIWALWHQNLLGKAEGQKTRDGWLNLRLNALTLGCDQH